MSSRATYKFVEFVRPDGYWPYPYSTDQAFAVLGWMLKTGESFRDKPKNVERNIFSLLSCKPTCTGFRTIDPIWSLDDLKRRFHHAILSGYAGPQLAEWRRRFGVFVGGRSVIVAPCVRLDEFPEGESNASFRKRLAWLFSCEGTLSQPLNERHHQATHVMGVRVNWLPSSHKWSFVMRYGYEGDQSWWDHGLATQRDGETFYGAFQRCVEELNRLAMFKNGANV